MIIGISGKIGSGKDLVGKIIQYLMAYNKANYVHPITEKDFNSYHLPKNRKHYFKIKKFADKLKDIICLLLNCTREQLENQDFKNKELGEEWWYYKVDTDCNTYLYTSIEEAYSQYYESCETSLVKLTPRKLLQLLGTDCGRDIIHPNIWLNALMSEYKPIEAPYKNLGDLLEDKHNGLLNNPNWIITDMRFPNELKAVKDKDGISIRVNRHGNYLKLGDYSTVKKEDIKNVTKQVLNIEHPSETALDDAKFDYIIDNNSTIEKLIEKVKQILIKEKII